MTFEQFNQFLLENEQKLNPGSGLMDFDPLENVLIFYDINRKLFKNSKG